MSSCQTEAPPTSPTCSLTPVSPISTYLKVDAIEADSATVRATMTNTAHCCGGCRHISVPGVTSTAGTGSPRPTRPQRTTQSPPLSVYDLSWAVLATDGVTNPLTHLGRADWANVAATPDRQLAGLLTAAHRWEREDDPTGRLFPRAKRHDDKTIATIPWSGGRCRGTAWKASATTQSSTSGRHPVCMTEPGVV